VEEGLAIARELGAKRLMISAFTDLGFIAHGQGDDALGTVRLTEALVIARELGDKFHTGESLIYLGNMARCQHDYASARSLFEEGLALFQELEDQFNIPDTLSFLGQLAQQEGDYRQAEIHFRESLRGWRALGNTQWKGVVVCLEGLACVCTFHRQFAEAARLFGAAEALQQALSISSSAMGAEISALRTQLGEVAFAAAWAEGRALSAEQAIDYALTLPPITTSPVPPVMHEVVAHESVIFASSSYPAGLSAREIEVLRLLAQGLTYAQIADKLLISRRTVNAHMTSIYGKLGVTSRALATRFALEHQLV
jgi:DNA-binding CsgD family transcriptional regulator